MIAWYFAKFKRMAEWMEETSAPCNRVQPNIGMHILRAVLFTFPKVLTWRIYLAIESLISWRSFPLQFTVTQGWYCKEKLDVSQS